MITNALVVDDDPVSRAVLSHLLSRHGYDVHEADAPESARAHVAETEFEVVFSDFHMPGESGLDLFRSLHQLGDRAKFVLVSGVVELPSANLAELGVDAVLPKPVMTRAVAECLDRLGLPLVER
ncbi:MULTISPECIES: response regulator [Microbacterium]|uniref:Response regulator n=1 Tax=Microbacterium marmarense TaxID=3122051 RepID=A0ABU8LRK9_9MICO